MDTRVDSKTRSRRSDRSHRAASVSAATAAPNATPAMAAPVMPTRRRTRAPTTAPPSAAWATVTAEVAPPSASAVRTVTATTATPLRARSRTVTMAIGTAASIWKTLWKNGMIADTTPSTTARPPSSPTVATSTGVSGPWRAGPGGGRRSSGPIPMSSVRPSRRGWRSSRGRPETEPEARSRSVLRARLRSESVSRSESGVDEADPGAARPSPGPAAIGDPGAWASSSGEKSERMRP